MQRHAVEKKFAMSVLIAVMLASSATAAADLAPPDEPGPFQVGTTTFPALMSGGRITQIQVFYPTLDVADCQTQYTIFMPAGTYQLDSPLCAVENARALPGSFPLVVHDHGGNGPGADFQRVAELPLHEHMASHGFVTVVALHSANAVSRVQDLSWVMDAMLARSATDGDLLADSIDPARIGISGVSAGGSAAIGAAGGWAVNGIVGDARIKAMVVYEPAVVSFADAASITIPYLVMGGLQNKWGRAIPDLFDATVDASPRFYVLTPSATHFSYVTSMGAEIDQCREAALLADPSLADPLTTRVATNAAAARAYDLWNQGEILFPVLGVGAGSGRNFCDRVGVNSVRSLDTSPQDGFTDSPPFLANDPFNVGPVIPEELMIPMIKGYTVAFWKKYLEGDDRYMRYLTPGFARRNGLEAFVEIE